MTRAPIAVTLAELRALYAAAGVVLELAPLGVSFGNMERQAGRAWRPSLRRARAKLSRELAAIRWPPRGAA